MQGKREDKKLTSLRAKEIIQDRSGIKVALYFQIGQCFLSLPALYIKVESVRGRQGKEGEAGREGRVQGLAVTWWKGGFDNHISPRRLFKRRIRFTPGMLKTANTAIYPDMSNFNNLFDV